MLDDATQSEFRDAIRRALDGYPDRLGVTQNQAVGADTVASLFAVAAENGWLSLTVPAEAGGLGFGMTGATLLAAEIGRAAAPGPFLANVVLLPMLASLDSASVPGDLAQGVMDGTRRFTIASRSGFDGDTRVVVEHARGATDVALMEEAGRGLRLRLAAAPEWAYLDPFDPLSPMATFSTDADEPAFADVTLGRTEAEMILGAANLWTAAEMLGAAERAGELAVAHAGQRKQFGQLIGSYQAVKHRIVDDYVLRQNAAAIILRATSAWDAGANDRVMLAHAARVAAGEAALKTCSYCIQIHGGMGFSWEHEAHLYYKRVRRLVNLLGSAAESRSALGQAICGVAA